MLPLLHRIHRQIDELDVERLQILIIGAMAFVLFAVIGGFTALFGDGKIGLEWLIVGVALMTLAAIVAGTMTIVMKIKVKRYNAKLDDMFSLLSGK